MRGGFRGAKGGQCRDLLPFPPGTLLPKMLGEGEPLFSYAEGSQGVGKDVRFSVAECFERSVASAEVTVYKGSDEGILQPAEGTAVRLYRLVRDEGDCRDWIKYMTEGGWER